MIVELLLDHYPDQKPEVLPEETPKLIPWCFRNDNDKKKTDAPVAAPTTQKPVEAPQKQRPRITPPMKMMDSQDQRSTTAPLITTEPRGSHKPICNDMKKTNVPAAATSHKPVETQNQRPRITPPPSMKLVDFPVPRPAKAPLITTEPRGFHKPNCNDNDKKKPDVPAAVTTQKPLEVHPKQKPRIIPPPPLKLMDLPVKRPATAPLITAEFRGFHKPNCNDNDKKKTDVLAAVTTQKPIEAHQKERPRITPPPPMKLMDLRVQRPATAPLIITEPRGSHKPITVRQDQKPSISAPMKLMDLHTEPPADTPLISTKPLSRPFSRSQPVKKQKFPLHKPVFKKSDISRAPPIRRSGIFSLQARTRGLNLTRGPSRFNKPAFNGSNMKLSK